MLRRAEDGDVERMRSWRNQDANRDVSLQQHVIGPDEHRAWWERTRQDPSRRVLVFEHDGRAIGVVNYFDLVLDGEPRTGSWGFYLDHDTTSADGTAMMAWMQVMKEAVDYAFADEPDGLALDVLEAEVLEENAAVRQMNRRFRFTEGAPEQREIDGRTVTVYPISLRREDRRRRKETRG